jgi:hypothetical protein
MATMIIGCYMVAMESPIQSPIRPTIRSPIQSRQRRQDTNDHSGLYVHFFQAT